MANPAPSGMDAAGLLSVAEEAPPGRSRPRRRSLRCTTVLREEHALVERLLDLLDRAAGTIRDGGPVRDGAFVRAFGLMNAFICRGHYAKERHLLDMMMARGARQARAFLEEHRDSLDFAAAMLRSLPEATRGDQAARRMLAENATAYVGFMRAHMRREEDDVFSAADELLTESDDAAAAAAYAEVDSRTGGPFEVELARDVEPHSVPVPGAVRGPASA